MAIFALADLHLSLAVNKPMNVFGDQWQYHMERIRESWLGTVRDVDTVLIPGDISWAMTLEEAHLDLSWIAELPGVKVMIRGNHDYWWHSISKVRKVLPDNLFAVQNDVVCVSGWAICGTRGWLLPSHPKYTEEDDKLFRRETERLRMSLQAAQKTGLPILAMMHYPPLALTDTPTGFSHLLTEYGVDACVYGHLHGASHRFAVEGTLFGVEYRLVSADYTQFQPKLIR